ncbi:MAG: InlB B-repeat-containing protein, partial [Clostridia bacterium]|nr:InlB B-repeat-containing protein [Clostridia bacterium]
VNDITIPIHNENKTEDETVHVRAEIEEGTNTATVTEVYIDLENVIGDEVDTGVVTIDFSALQEVPEYAALEIDTIVIPTDIIHNIAEAAKDAHNDTEGLEIVLAENLSIQFDAVALDRKMEQTESDGKITVSILPKEHERAYLNETQHSAVGERPAYNIRLSDENGEEIHDLGGEIILKAPYTLGSNENPKGIVVYYVAEDGSRERCETSYDSAGKCVTWKTDHLSVYMIEYEPVISKIPALCDLSFETNVGTALPTVPRAFGSQAGLSRFIPARDGYTFTGWYADEDLTRKITKIVMIGYVTVYAGWESAADEE